MKKIAIILLSLFLMLTGCSKGSNNENAAPEPTSNAADSSANQEKGSEEQGAIEVDKGLLSVEITLPASMFEGQDIDQVIASAKEEGVTEVKKNEDGSVTYKMPKSVHKNMMKEMESEIIASLDELKNGEDFQSIKDVKHNDSFTEFTLIVEKSAYEGSFDGFAALGLGLQGMFYQAFNGVAADKQKVTIHIEDESTGDVFNTVEYPDALSDLELN